MDDFRLDSPTGMGDVYHAFGIHDMRIRKYPTMKLIQTLVVVSLLAVFAAPVEAKGNGKAEQEKAKKEKERAERKRVREAVEAFITPRDKNKDGSLTKEELLSGETDKAAGEKKFNDANKNNDRALYKTEIQAMLGL
jgi:Flp pilus assembly protein TadD